jgi:hypothetical protein
MVEQALTKTATVAEAVELALATGDIGKLTTADRVNYYNAVCKSLSINPLTRPFEYIELDGKLTLYCRRDATDQLRKLNNVSVTITKTERMEDVYVVTAEARMGDRVDTSTGAVALAKEGGSWETASSGKKYFKGNGVMSLFRGDALANALMKAETKAKRRVTLSIVGLGFLDETEIETIPTAKPVNPIDAAPEIPYTSSPESQAKIEAKAAQPAPLNDWIADAKKRAYFWAQTKDLGFTNDQTHTLLGVERMGQYRGTLDQALDQLRGASDAPAAVPFTDEADVAQ